MELKPNTAPRCGELGKEKLQEWHRLATRYLQGESLTERECLWLQQVSLSGGENIHLDAEEVERMDRAVRHVLWNERMKKLFRLNRMQGMVAAILVLVVMCGAWWAWYTPSHQDKEVRLVADNRVQTVSLPDGSVIHLNVGSTLLYSANRFGRDSRDVQLQGEAFFQVAKDASCPFRVKGSGATVTVCGTSFNVKAYPSCQEMVVSVRDGRVQVADSTQHPLATLTANRQLVYNRTTGEARLDNLPWQEAAGWKDGLVVFNGAGMEEICLKAVHYYGLRLLPRADTKVSLCGTYPTDDGGQALLQQLQDIYGLKHRKEGGNMVLYQP